MKALKNMNKGVLAAAICAIVLVIVAAVFIIKSFVGSSSIKITPGEPFDYEAKGFLTLGEYKGINVSVAVSDEDVADEIDNILSEAEEYEHVEGTVKSGDMVDVDLKATLDGTELEDWSIENEFITVGDEDYFIELDNALIGMNTGESKTVEVSVPADYGDEVIDGKTVVFDMKLNYICGEAITPEITDEFVTQYSEGACTSAADFNKYVEDTIYQENVDYVGETAWEEVIANVNLKKYNKVEVENAREETIKSYENFAEMSGMSTEELLDSFGMTEEDVDDVANDAALERMTAKTIAAKEGLKMDNESYKQLIIENMEYEDNSYESMTLEELENDYFESFSEDPKEAMLLELVKKYVGDNANVAGLRAE